MQPPGEGKQVYIKKYILLIQLLHPSEECVHGPTGVYKLSAVIMSGPASLEAITPKLVYEIVIWEWFGRALTQSASRAASRAVLTIRLPLQGEHRPGNTTCSRWALVGLQSTWGTLGYWQAHSLLLWQMWNVPPCPKEVNSQG